MPKLVEYRVVRGKEIVQVSELSPNLPQISVLAVVQLKTQLNELLRAATVLRNSQRYRVVFCLDTESPKLFDEMNAQCADAGFETVPFSIPDGIPPGWHEVGWKRSLRAWFFSRVFSAILEPSAWGLIARWFVGLRGDAEDTYAEANHFTLCWSNELEQTHKAVSLLSRIKPRLVLVGEDGTGGNAAIVALAQEHGIQTLIIPYEYSQKKQILMSVGLRFPLRPTSPFDRLLASRFPKWVHTRDDGVEILRMPAVIALAREYQRLAPVNPWTVHGGIANKIAVESEIMRQHYSGEGLPDEKLAYTGALASDDMYRMMKSDAASALAFDRGSKRDPGKTHILCAIPPDYVDHPSAKCEFKSFCELADFWIDSLLAIPNAEVVFQTHPGIGKKDAEYVRSRVNVTDDNISSLIPRCDVLVTSVSSIIRLAIICRKPVVNYDVYNFAYRDYLEAPGVMAVTDKGKFQAAIQGLSADSAFYSATVASQIKDGSGWGVLDGQSADRFLKLSASMSAR